MRDGIIESAADAKWLIAAGREDYTEAQAFLDGLSDVALWYAYEVARSPANGDIKIGKDGHLLIAINDDVNPPGWYHYRKRTEDNDAARAYIREKCGEVVSVPLRAILSDKPVGLW